MIGRTALFAAMAMAIGGCAVASHADDGPYPDNYKDIVRSVLKGEKEPRGVAISAPAALTGRKAGWLVCFRANAKNEYGAYAGLHVSALVIRNDRYVERASDQSCGKASYTPWPDWDQATAAHARE